MLSLTARSLKETLPLEVLLELVQDTMVNYVDTKNLKISDEMHPLFDILKNLGYSDIITLVMCFEIIKIVDNDEIVGKISGLYELEPLFSKVLSPTNPAIYMNWHELEIYIDDIGFDLLTLCKNKRHIIRIMFHYVYEEDDPELINKFQNLVKDVEGWREFCGIPNLS